MVVVGITGRRRRAAAAVAVDGTIVAAVSESMLTRVPAAGYREVGFPVASVRACLKQADLDVDAVDLIVEADGTHLASSTAGARIGCGARSIGLQRAALKRTGTLEAYARQAAVVMASGVVLAADLQHSCAAIARIDARGGASLDPLPGLATLLELTHRLARELGLPLEEPGDILQGLELLALSTAVEMGTSFSTMIDASEGDPLIDVAKFHDELARAASAAGGSLADAASPRVAVQRTRASVAEGFLRLLAASMARTLAAITKDSDTSEVVLAGSAFLSPDFNARLRTAATRALRVAPAPSPEGAAFGAALLPFAVGGASGVPGHLALGPSFTESESKIALENCRLDYVYEPAWPRLIERVSRVLARGKLVAWFQQSAEFGPSLMGSRSVLADPSNRYARDNVNRFLRRRPDDWPIAVSIAPEARECLDGSALSPWDLERATVQPAWREQLRAAVDSRGGVHAHVMPASSDGPFRDLLALHWQRTGVPGLLNVGLQGVGEPVACSPRDAIRAAFSSAVDAMVIHRFLLMKDYWQLRTGDA
jgi:carbamoyltransferase